MNSNLNVDRQAGEEIKVDERKESRSKRGLVIGALKRTLAFFGQEMKNANEQRKEINEQNRERRAEKIKENPNLQRAAEGGKKIIEGLADVGGGLYNGTKEALAETKEAGAKAFAEKREAGLKAFAEKREAGAKAFAGAKESGLRHLSNGAKTTVGVMTALDAWGREKFNKIRESHRIKGQISKLRGDISRLEDEINTCKKLQKASDKVRAEFNSNIEEIDELKKEIEDEKEKEDFVKTLKSARVKTKMGKRFSRANPEKKIESLGQKNEKLMGKLNDQGEIIMSKEKEIEKKLMEIDALQEKLAALEIRNVEA